MPRPCKGRRVCALPGCTSFAPLGRQGKKVVTMSVDEYETIRLIDLENLTQQQCAQQMEVARATVQTIYASARKKLAQCVVQGATLTIGGGQYRLCQQIGRPCPRNCHSTRAYTAATTKQERKILDE